MKGISTNRRTTNHVAGLRQAGVAFVARYYSTTTIQPEKRLTLPEAQAISAAGMTIVAVYEDGPTQVGYFSTSRGRRDGSNAYHAAVELLQPSGAAIYFAVDYDATSSDLAQAISDYFRGVVQGFADAAQGVPPIYSIGVYGSGACCSWIKDHLRIAKYSWLAESTGWHGSHTYSDWNIKQSIATAPLCAFTGGIGGAYENNETQNEIGDFKLSPPGVVIDAVNAAIAAEPRAVRPKRRAPAAQQTKAAPAATAWAALFEMKLGTSTQLIEGRLTLSNNGNTIFDGEATSGTRGHQTKNDLWTKNLGPLPANPDSAAGNSIETLERSTATISREFRIRPEEVVQPTPPHTRRNEFRAHQDGGAPGSAGCIAISDAGDFERFAGIMHDLHSHGVETVPLRIKYS
jgi:hypothetical protein